MNLFTIILSLDREIHRARIRSRTLEMINAGWIKETKRLIALKNELTKLGANLDITESSLKLYKTREIKKNITINTYQDHRMAMSFAPLSLKVPIFIENPNVVVKSYPKFWDDLKKAGFTIEQT